VPILYVLIPVIPAKFCRYLPVLESPEYRKTGFGIAGIGNTITDILRTNTVKNETFEKNQLLLILATVY
jgi:hypothetical protein